MLRGCNRFMYNYTYVEVVNLTAYLWYWPGNLVIWYWKWLFMGNLIARIDRFSSNSYICISFCPFALREVSVLTELTLGHLRYLLTDVPPQSNSPPDTVFRADRAADRRGNAAVPRSHPATTPHKGTPEGFRAGRTPEPSGRHSGA